SEFLFLADERDRSVALKAFNVEVSRSLHVDVICQQLCNLLRTGFSGITAITIAVADNKGDFRISADTSALTIGQLIFTKDNPAVQWCVSHPDGGRISDFRYSLEYKSMWESEKKRFYEMNTDYIFPLLDAGELIGVVLLACKDSIRSLHSEDLNFISSANTVASIAIKNSRMYEKACHDARTDDLTGLLNRKYFMEELNQCIENDPYGILTLAIINLDDFKLYNQLYGAAEGDQALRRVANILSRNAGENTIVARYSGKEFALLMPGREPSSAFRLAESLRLQIYNMNRVEEPSAHMGSMSILTCSIGICSIPFGATTAKQLLDNVDMTVYQVKKAGKNGVKVYSVDPDNLGADLTVPQKNHEEAYSEFAQTLYALTTTIDTKDHYTFTHSNNVAYYSVQLATALGLNKETVEIIRQAALLHDIGKIGIPESILNKPTRLTNEEYEIIKKHPENAVAIIRHLPNLDYLIPAVISHHERWDGKGYPRRIGGEDIPLSGRILCVADCFDAMTGRRCYQDGRDVESALQDLEVNAGKQFDPTLAKLFVQKFREGFIQLQVRPNQDK
ncbi:MAG: HD domain-containing phosphohydrolase, partial [Butyricicoccus sp.]